MLLQVAGGGEAAAALCSPLKFGSAQLRFQPGNAGMNRPTRPAAPPGGRRAIEDWPRNRRIWAAMPSMARRNDSVRVARQPRRLSSTAQPRSGRRQLR
jgi:hypothetical protein